MPVAFGLNATGIFMICNRQNIGMLISVFYILIYLELIVYLIIQIPVKFTIASS